MLRTKSTSCCGQVKVFYCPRLQREVWHTKCNRCGFYQPETAHDAQQIKPKPLESDTVPEGCPDKPEMISVCPRYKIVVTADICARCKSDPIFRQSLYARYVRNRAAYGLPCKYRSERRETKFIPCCNGAKTMRIHVHLCTLGMRCVADPDCWMCEQYEPVSRKANPMYAKVLNAKLSPRVPMIDAAEPDVRFFNLHAERVVFDANSLCAVHVDEHAEQAIRSNEENVFQGLLFSRNKPQFRLARATPVRRVVLNVTHACNLACTYCFAGGNQPGAGMSITTARKGIQLLDPRSTVDIAFFGGEPLLAWDLVKQVMKEAHDLARKRKTRAKFHITTNGLLLDEAKVKFLSQQPCSTLVSLDGPEAIHNAARPARDPKVNSFARTLKALECARGSALGQRIMARATFNTSEPQLVRRLEFFAGLDDEGLIRGYSIEPAVLGEGCAHRGGKLDRQAIVREYHEAAEWFVTRIQAGRSANFFHFRKLLDRILHAKHSGSECGAGNGYITVGADGTLYACHREAGTRIGHVDYGFDEELRSCWADNRVYARNGCMKCWARYLCGGGCRQACLELAGNLYTSVPERCFLQKTMLKECLWILTQVEREQLVKGAVL